MPGSHRERYYKYLTTDEWESKRLLRKALDGNYCYRCHRFIGLYYQVHHMRYPSKIGEEKIDDLVCLCGKCHKKISDDKRIAHRLERHVVKMRKAIRGAIRPIVPCSKERLEELKARRLAAEARFDSLEYPAYQPEAPVCQPKVARAAVARKRHEVVNPKKSIRAEKREKRLAAVQLSFSRPMDISRISPMFRSTVIAAISKHTGD